MHVVSYVFDSQIEELILGKRTYHGYTDDGCIIMNRLNKLRYPLFLYDRNISGIPM